VRQPEVDQLTVAHYLDLPRIHCLSPQDDEKYVNGRSDEFGVEPAFSVRHAETVLTKGD
jgi:hypothetical protein